jgi:hypothetical protein
MYSSATPSEFFDGVSVPFSSALSATPVLGSFPGSSSVFATHPDIVVSPRIPIANV